MTAAVTIHVRPVQKSGDAHIVLEDEIIAYDELGNSIDLSPLVRSYRITSEVGSLRRLEITVVKFEIVEDSDY